MDWWTLCGSWIVMILDVSGRSGMTSEMSLALLVEDMARSEMGEKG
jgi:hypothetical protein